MEEQETRVKSFRITDETAEKFKEIASTIGGNQQETLAKLIENYEMQAGKVAFTDTRAEIEQFEGYTIALNRMFMTAIENQQNMKKLIQAEYDAQLKSKDTVIIELQKKTDVLETQTKEAIEKAKESENVANLAKKELAQLKDKHSETVQALEEKIESKEQLNIALTDSINSLKKKSEELESKCKQLKELEKEHKTEVCNLKNDLNKSNEELEKKEKELDILNIKMDSQIKEYELEIKKTLIDSERDYNKKLSNIEETHREKVDNLQAKLNEYQEKYFDSMQKVQELTTKADNGVDEGIEIMRNIVASLLRSGNVEDVSKILSMTKNEIYNYEL